MHACGERATLTYEGPRPPTCDYRCSLGFQKPLGGPMLLEWREQGGVGLFPSWVVLTP